MPKSKKPNRRRGDTRTVAKPTASGNIHPMRAPRSPVAQARTQVRGGRPPRFPGRTGGR